MQVDLKINVPTDRITYVIHEALLRNISVTELMNRVLDTVLQDRMFLSVLDDDMVRPVAKLPLPAVPPRKTRVSLDDRCKTLLDMIQKRGRICASDLGGSYESMKWQAAIAKLRADGVIRSEPPEEKTRRVYHVLNAPEQAIA
jgi:hypothetical protein